MAITTIALNIFFTSCKGESKSTVNFEFDPEIVPTMKTYYDTMFISDSGIIKYKTITKIWEMYEQAKEPFWYFPEKVYMEQFDTLFNIIAIVKADTAWNYTKQKLWKLKGNVYARNATGTTLTSQELYWNSKDGSIYSNQYVEINDPEKGMTNGVHGFKSNQDLTEYVFFKVTDAPIYVRENEENTIDPEIDAQEENKE